MRLGIVHWKTRSVGGIATVAQTMQKAARDYGDECDILLADDREMQPGKFKTPRRVYGGDTYITVNGRVPYGKKIRESIAFLEENYDALYFTFVCPHPCKRYPSPKFMPFYSDTTLPKITCITDGYWSEYAEWGRECINYVNVVSVSVPTFATPLRDEGIDNIINTKIPFSPLRGQQIPKDRKPLLIWTNQWKEVKRVDKFLKIVPFLPKQVRIEMYSTGIKYYQLREKAIWQEAVDKDYFKEGFDGKGRAFYYGNKTIEEIHYVNQRAWLSCNLQGMGARNPTYKEGSYNNTEIEALFYGVCPILHKSVINVGIPEECCIIVDSEEEIPAKVAEAIEFEFPLNRIRMQRARDYVCDNHLASTQYQMIRSYLV